MRVTITTENGREFSGSDLKEARKVEARIKREEAKRAKAEAENYDTARLRAESVAFRMLDNWFRTDDEGNRKPMPRGFGYQVAGVSDYAEAKLIQDDERGLILNVCVGYSAEDGTRIIGQKEWYHRDQLIGLVANSAGCMAIVVKWSNEKETKVVAVGVHKGTVALVEIPALCGLTADAFRQSKLNGE